MHTTTEADLSPAERPREIAAILAAGILPLRTRPESCAERTFSSHATQTCPVLRNSSGTHDLIAPLSLGAQPCIRRSLRKRGLSTSHSRPLRPVPIHPELVLSTSKGPTHFLSLTKSLSVPNGRRAPPFCPHPPKPRPDLVEGSAHWRGRRRNSRGHDLQLHVRPGCYLHDLIFRAARRPGVDDVFSRPHVGYRERTIGGCLRAAVIGRYDSDREPWDRTPDRANPGQAEWDA